MVSLKSEIGLDLHFHKISNMTKHKSPLLTSSKMREKGQSINQTAELAVTGLFQLYVKGKGTRLHFPSGPSVPSVRSCQNTATSWLMNSGRGPSRTHPVHPMLVTSHAQQLKATLWRQQHLHTFTRQPLKAPFNTPWHSSGRRLKNRSSLRGH